MRFRSITFVGDQYHRPQTKLMGYSIRVDEWRYTVWFPFDGAHTQLATVTTLAAGSDVGIGTGRELYNHKADIGLWLGYPGEEVSLALDPANALDPAIFA